MGKSKKELRKEKPKKDKKKLHNVQSSISKSVIIALLPIVFGCLKLYMTSRSGNTTLASSTEVVEELRFQNVTCSADYKQRPVVAGCTPTRKCGRHVVDELFSPHEVAVMKDLLLKSLKHGGSSGGASIIDLHSGAMSMKDQFVDIRRCLEPDQLREIFTKEAIETYSKVKTKIRDLIASTLEIDPRHLHLTSPTFFSRITAEEAKTKHDEYWHRHIDKIQYGSFDYTSLLYLSDYGVDFQGGRFVFEEDGHGDVIIEPRLGRVSFFTSGSENPHRVERVTEGTRLAMTVAFTCDVTKAIGDPKVVE